MKNFTKKILYIFIVLAVVIGVGTFSTCYNFESLCLQSTHEILALFFLLFSSSIFLISLVLLFLGADVFKSWLIFSAWFLPLSALFITLAREDHNALDIIPDKEITVMLMTGFYFFISLVVIVIKSWKLRGKRAIR